MQATTRRRLRKNNDVGESSSESSLEKPKQKVKTNPENEVVPLKNQISDESPFDLNKPFNSALGYNVASLGELESASQYDTFSGDDDT